MKITREKTLIVACLFVLSLLSLPSARGEIYSYIQGKNFPGSGVSAITSLDGEVLLGTLTSGLFRFDPGKSTFAPLLPDVFRGKEVRSIVSFKGKIYVGTRDGLYVVEGKRAQKVEKIGKIFLKNVLLARDERRDLLFVESSSLSGGLLTFDGKDWKFLGGEGKGLFNDVTAIEVAEEGVYLGSLGGALYLYDGTGIDLAVKEFFPSTIFSLKKFGESLYVGTGKGLYRVASGKVFRVNVKGAGDSAVFSLTVKDGVLYGGTESGLVRVAGRKVEFLPLKRGDKVSRVRTIAFTDGDLLAGTLDGFFVIRGW